MPRSCGRERAGPVPGLVGLPVWLEEMSRSRGRETDSPSVISLVSHCLDLASSLSDGEPVQGLEQ